MRCPADQRGRRHPIKFDAHVKDAVQDALTCCMRETPIKWIRVECLQVNQPDLLNDYTQSGRMDTSFAQVFTIKAILECKRREIQLNIWHPADRVSVSSWINLPTLPCV